jgi:hypothetical protein
MKAQRISRTMANTNLLRGDEAPHPEILEKMRRRPATLPGTRWMAYQNHDLSHQDLGHLKFLAVGPRNSAKLPAPLRLPDMPGEPPLWRYVLVGEVDLDTGEISQSPAEQSLQE